MRNAALGVIAFLVLGGCSRERAPAVPHEAPGFVLKDLSGNEVTLRQFRGHPVLLDFWATWCPPCLISAPFVEAFYERHKKEGLVVLGLNMDDDRSQVFAYTKKMKIAYPVLLASDSSVPADYGIEAFPSFVLIDAQGKAVQLYEGFAPKMLDAWEAQLQDLSTPSH